MPGSAHGPSIKNPATYEALKREGKSKSAAAAISNAALNKGYAKGVHGRSKRKRRDAATIVDVQITELQAFDANWNDEGECKRLTRDGFLVCTPRVARTGIQLYRGIEVGRPEMDVVRVYRPESEVFDNKAMSSLAWRPITLDHPFENVTSKNWKEYAIGGSSGDVARDGEFIRVPMTLMDQTAIDAVEAGTAQLSVGYSAKLVWGDGETPDGEAYDAMQTEIRGNHIAVVSDARGGSKLRIGDQDDDEPDDDDDDADDAMMTCPECDGTGKLDGETCPECDGSGKVDASKDAEPEDDGYADREFSAEQRKQAASKGQAMPHGGFPIKNESDLRNAIRAVGRAKNPAAAKAHIKKRARALGKSNLIPESWDSGSEVISERSSKMTQRTVMIDGVSIELEEKDSQILDRHLKSITDQLAALTTQLATLKTDLAAKDGEIAVLKKQVTDAQWSPQKIDDEVDKRLKVREHALAVLGDKYDTRGKTDVQIRREVVAACYGDQFARDLSDEGMLGAFAACSAKGKSNGNLGPVVDAFNRGSQQIHSSADASEAAYEARNKSLRDAWKTPPRQVREVR